jgi:hypothetical protein
MPVETQASVRHFLSSFWSHEDSMGTKVTTLYAKHANIRASMLWDRRTRLADYDDMVDVAIKGREDLKAAQSTTR